MPVVTNMAVTQNCDLIETSYLRRLLYPRVHCAWYWCYVEKYKALVKLMCLVPDVFMLNHDNVT
jgi:hypothetical protein